MSGYYNSSNTSDYINSGNSSERSSRDSSPTTSTTYNMKNSSGGTTNFTHSGNVTIVDHNASIRDNYPKSTSYRPGYHS